MVHIYYSYISENDHDRLIQHRLPEFSIEFQQRVLKYRRWQDVQLSLLGRLLLKHGFSTMNEIFYDQEIEMTKYNKPFLPGSQVHFNISHSGNIAICTLTDRSSIGIDVELKKKIDVQDFKSQMTSKEWMRVSGSSDSQSAFYEYWTQKEAVIKAHGHGLSLPLKSFVINDNYTIIKGTIFQCKEIQLDPSYLCYVAWEGDFDLKINGPELVHF